jgi:DNA-binding transcriptional MerR regulator
VQLVRIGELAKRAGVPVATLKHYLREGLIAPTRKSGKTMSWYDPGLVTKIRAIKELQRRQFLPLDLIRKSIEQDHEAPDDVAAADAIAKVLARHGGKRTRTRDEVLAKGASATELEWLAAAGLAIPTGPDQRYSGDDLALLTTLGAARRVGIDPDMLPFDVLAEYLTAMQKLVDIELRIFREGVMRKAKPGEVGKLTTAAADLSERLVVLIRRKLLLPTLQRLVEEDAPRPAKRPRAKKQRRS